jgi:hypothetical protein
MSYDGWAVLGRGSPWSLWGDPIGRFRRVRTHVYAVLLAATRRPGAWLPSRLNRQGNRLTEMPYHAPRPRPDRSSPRSGMPSRSSFHPGHRGGRPDVDGITLAVPAKDRLLLGLGRSGGPTGPRCRAPDSSAPHVSAPGRIEARRSRRSPNRIKRLRHSSPIARTKAPPWALAFGAWTATRRGRGPCLARSAEHSHGVVSPTGSAHKGLPSSSRAALRRKDAAD